MAERTRALEVFQSLMGCVGNLYTWQYDGELNLLWSNCPEEQYWSHILRVSLWGTQILEHCRTRGVPVLLSDPLGLMWIAAPEREGEALRSISLIGPVFHSTVSETRVEQVLTGIGLPGDLKSEFLRLYRRLPVVTYTQFVQYGVMLHFCVTGEKLLISDIALSPAAPAPGEDSPMDPSAGDPHGSESYEQLMLQLVADGNLNYRELLYSNAKFSARRTFCPDNPLRQFQDEIIVAVTLFSRAAVRGGLSYEQSCALAEYFIQEVEAADTISKLAACNREMRDTFVRRVHDCRRGAVCSQPIRDCLDYIDAHLFEKIDVAKMSTQVGYAGYYLTTLFKKELGVSASDYVKGKKVEYAKLQLTRTKLEVSLIADRLGFSSSSYFCSVFRAFTGLTPSEYRKQEQG